jgi:AAA+ ATPase superfamily predicted ATPase
MDIPFTFGRIVTGAQFLNRKAELRKLKKNINQHAHTILIAPRRWGKSSLIHQLSKKMSKDKNMKFVFIELFGLSDNVEFYERYAKAILQRISTKPSGIEDHVFTYLKELQLDITFKNKASNDFNLSLPWAKHQRDYRQILDLAESIAEKRKEKWIICLDEFQFLGKMKHPDQFLSKIRSAWQKHTHVVYILIGSKHGMINKIHGRPGHPFFEFGDIIVLNKIKKKHFSQYIMSTFQRSGRTIPRERVDIIIQLAAKNPYFIQKLSRYVWLNSSELIVDADIQVALEEIMLQNSTWYVHEVERMTPPQFNFLKAIANEEHTLSGQEVIRKYKLGSSANVAKIKRVMEEREILDFHDSKTEFNDPFFKLWIRKQVIL